MEMSELETLFREILCFHSEAAKGVKLNLVFHRVAISHNCAKPTLGPLVVAAGRREIGVETRPGGHCRAGTKCPPRRTAARDANPVPSPKGPKSEARGEPHLLQAHIAARPSPAPRDSPPRRRQITGIPHNIATDHLPHVPEALPEAPGPRWGFVSSRYPREG